MEKTLQVRLQPYIVPDPPMALVGVLSNFPDILGHRLICRRTFDGLSLDYHLAINQRLAKRLNRLLDTRPFPESKRLRDSRAATLYWGIASVEKRQIYLLLTQGKSRRKQKVRVPAFVMMELAWVGALDAHHLELGRPVIEA